MWRLHKSCWRTTTRECQLLLLRTATAAAPPSTRSVFVSLMVEILGLLLLTATELVELRHLLRRCLHSLSSTEVVGLPVLDEGAEAKADETQTAGNAAEYATPRRRSKTEGTDAAMAPGGDGSDGHGSARGKTMIAGSEMFEILFKTWSYNPISVVALCLLAEAYPLAARLVTSM